MLCRRILKLEASLPVSPGKLLERLDRQAMNALSAPDRELVSEKLHGAGRRPKSWSPEHQAAEARYLDNFAILLQEVSDDDLAGLISQMEDQTGGSHPEAIA